MVHARRCEQRSEASAKPPRPTATRDNQTSKMKLFNKAKPFLITALIAVVAVKLVQKYLDPKLPAWAQ